MNKMNDLDHCYKVLGLLPGASKDEVNQAYKDLAFIWHPDRIPADNHRLKQKAQEKLKEINQARDKLRSIKPSHQAQTRTPQHQPKPASRERSPKSGSHTKSPSQSHHQARPSNPDLSGADFRGASLKEKDLSGRNLSNADLSNANLSDAFLHKINLQGANLEKPTSSELICFKLTCVMQTYGILT
jgi:curved DNA-binding protein CbpA